MTHPNTNTAAMFARYVEDQFRKPKTFAGYFVTEPQPETPEEPDPMKTDNETPTP